MSFLLDAHIRRLTNGRKSMDDVMRIAYARHGGERGFTADQLRAVVEEVAGSGMKPWFTRTIGTAGELDYGEMLGWYGCVSPAAPATAGPSKYRPKATTAQENHFKALLTSSGPGTRCAPRR